MALNSAFTNQPHRGEAPERRELHPARLPIEELLDCCDVKRTRASGPGGQHRNKVETAVQITHRPSGFMGEASERRSQEQNLKQAIQRLRIRLAVAVRTDALLEPSTLWRGRVSGRRVSVSSAHEDFPALLAEVLDVLDAQAYAVADVANWFGVTTSQLVKFLKLEPASLSFVNQERERLGERRLR